MEQVLNKYCRISNTPADALSQAKYTSFVPNGKNMSST